MEGVPSGLPQPPDQPAQGLSTGSPLPQLRGVQGVTRPAPLADRISSRRREPQRVSGVAGAPSELGTQTRVSSEAPRGRRQVGPRVGERESGRCSPERLSEPSLRLRVQGDPRVEGVWGLCPEGWGGGGGVGGACRW